MADSDALAGRITLLGLLAQEKINTALETDISDEVKALLLDVKGTLSTMLDLAAEEVENGSQC